MSQSNPYHPIDCNFYDRIEAAIVLRKSVQLVYRTTEGEERGVETVLQDTLNRAGEEFVVLPGEELIRMDCIVSLDGEVLSGSC